MCIYLFNVYRNYSEKNITEDLNFTLTPFKPLFNNGDILNYLAENLMAGNTVCTLQNQNYFKLNVFK